MTANEFVAQALRVAIGDTASRKDAPPPPLTLRKKHAGTIVRVARLLNVKPQNFLDWLLRDAVDSLNDPEGDLQQWVMGDLIAWGSPAEAEAARARYVAWLEREGLDAATIARMTRPRLAENQIGRVADHIEAVVTTAANLPARPSASGSSRP